MSLEQPSVDGAQPRKISLRDALLEQWDREAGTATNPDEYLRHERRPSLGDIYVRDLDREINTKRLN